MKQYLVYYVIASLALFHVRTQGKTCQRWVPIPPQDCSRNFTSITSLDANSIRPLGFKVTTLEFEGSTPCFVVAQTSGNDRHIEIKWELDQPGTLCFRSSELNTPHCNNGRTFQDCSTVPNGVRSINYTFLCEGNNCEGGAKQFWYRFVVEQPDENGQYDENWCSGRDSLFPSSLAPIPFTITPPTTTTMNGNASPVVGNRVFYISTFMLLVFLCNI